MEPIDFPLLAKHIREAHARALEASCRSLHHALWCGHLLLQAKDAVPHGRFEEWVVHHCGFTPQTARSYMRIARSGPLEPPNETSCREALRKLNSPPGPPKWRRPGPTPFDVAERMREFGVTGDLRQVLAFLRSFGVRIRDAGQMPNHPEAFRTGSAPAPSPPALPAPAPPPWPPHPGQNESALPICPPALPHSPARPRIVGAISYCPNDPKAAMKRPAAGASERQPGILTGSAGDDSRPWKDDSS